MEPTESAAPHSRLRLRRMTGAWRGFRPPQGPPRDPAGTGQARRAARILERAGIRASAGQARGQRHRAAHRRRQQGVGPARRPTSPPRAARTAPRPRSRTAAVLARAARGGRRGSPGSSSAPGSTAAFTGDHALFPSGTVGWSLAVLTGIIVGHLVALGRDRWWGGTGSGAALTLAVLLLYGWVPAGTGQPRRRRPGRRRPPPPLAAGRAARRGGHPRHRRRRARPGRLRRVTDRRDSPGTPPTWSARRRSRGGARRRRLSRGHPRCCSGTRCAPARGGLPTVARTALVRQGLVAVALLGIAPLICVVAVAQPAAAAAVRRPADRPRLHPVDRPRPGRGAAARPADRAAQPAVAAGADLDRPGRRRAHRRPVRAGADRPRPVPFGQRHARPSRRRPAAAADSRPAAARPAARRGGGAARRRRVRRPAARSPTPRPAPSASPATSSPRSARRSTSTGSPSSWRPAPGVAVFPDHALDAEGLLRRADVAMYQAKRDRTGVEVYESKRDCNTPDRLGLLGDLRRALDARRGRAALPAEGPLRRPGRRAGGAGPLGAPGARAGRRRTSSSRSPSPPG